MSCHMTNYISCIPDCGDRQQHKYTVLIVLDVKGTCGSRYCSTIARGMMHACHTHIRRSCGVVELRAPFALLEDACEMLLLAESQTSVNRACSRQVTACWLCL